MQLLLLHPFSLARWHSFFLCVFVSLIPTLLFLPLRSHLFYPIFLLAPLSPCTSFSTSRYPISSPASHLSTIVRAKGLPRFSILSSTPAFPLSICLLLPLTSTSFPSLTLALVFPFHLFLYLSCTYRALFPLSCHFLPTAICCIVVRYYFSSFQFCPIDYSP